MLYAARDVALPVVYADKAGKGTLVKAFVELRDGSRGGRRSRLRRMTFKPAHPALVNPTQDELLEREPLLGFSFYISGRVAVLLGFADEIVANLDEGFSGPVVLGGKVERAESLMWLWCLGAYEVVRTMHQAKSCLSPRALDELGQLKKLLGVVRMPAAKMEKPGRKEPVTSDRSPTGWDIEHRDLLVNDPEAPPDISARFVLSEFARVMSDIKKDDVLGGHAASYGT